MLSKARSKPISLFACLYSNFIKVGGKSTFETDKFVGLSVLKLYKGWWREDFAWWRVRWWRDRSLVASSLVASLLGGEVTGNQSYNLILTSGVRILIIYLLQFR